MKDRKLNLKKRIIAFKKQIWDFYKKQGRHDLPWRKTRDPYKILVSEVMLQQTQVARVREKYPEFLRAFPTINTLANVPLTDVLRVWQGMGYNRRALALYRLANKVVVKHSGKIPRTREELVVLPGVGSYTAGAILTFAFNKPEIFIETNIRRVFIHHFFHRKRAIFDKDILPLIKKTIDTQNPREWYWALMDYGAHLPKITANPNKKSAHYVKQQRFEGSHRQLRGRMLRYLHTVGKCTVSSCARTLEIAPEKAKVVLIELTREGFIEHYGKSYTVKN